MLNNQIALFSSIFSEQNSEDANNINQNGIESPQKQSEQKSQSNLVSQNAVELDSPLDIYSEDSFQDLTVALAKAKAAINSEVSKWRKLWQNQEVEDEIPPGSKEAKHKHRKKTGKILSPFTLYYL